MFTGGEHIRVRNLEHWYSWAACLPVANISESETSYIRTVGPPVYRWRTYPSQKPRTFLQLGRMFAGGEYREEAAVMRDSGQGWARRARHSRCAKAERGVRLGGVGAVPGTVRWSRRLHAVVCGHSCFA